MSDNLDRSIIILQAECKKSALDCRDDENVITVDGVVVADRRKTHRNECAEMVGDVVQALRNVRKRKLH